MWTTLRLKSLRRGERCNAKRRVKKEEEEVEKPALEKLREDSPLTEMEDEDQHRMPSVAPSALTELDDQHEQDENHDDEDTHDGEEPHDDKQDHDAHEENTEEKAILTALEVLHVKFYQIDHLSCYRGLEYPNLQKLDLRIESSHPPGSDYWWQPILHNAPYSRLRQVTLTITDYAFPLYLSDLVTQHPSIHSLTLNVRIMHETLFESDMVDLCEALRVSREGGRPLGLRQLTLSDNINLSSELINTLAELGVALSYCSPY